MSEEQFFFSKCEPAKWEGRYNRIPGHPTVIRIIHTRTQNDWWPTIRYVDSDDTVMCLAENVSNITELVEAVNNVKMTNKGRAGGSFIINEHGQALVQSYNKYENELYTFLIGEVQGKLLFKNQSEDIIIDLSDDTGLKTGDTWNKPFVGMPYRLSEDDKIHYVKVGNKIYPKKQDDKLIQTIRSVRPEGLVKFIVNPYGIVLATKTAAELDPNIPAERQSLYIGRIDYDNWYEKGE